MARDKTEIAFVLAENLQRNRADLKEIIRLAQRGLEYIEKVEPGKTDLHSGYMHVSQIKELADAVAYRSTKNDTILFAAPDDFLVRNTPEGALMLKAMITGCEGPSSTFEYEPTGRKIPDGFGHMVDERRLAREIFHMPGKPDVVRNIDFKKG